MFLRKLSWAQLTKDGIPPLFVLRPLAGGFTPPNLGDEYPAPNPVDKLAIMRCRQMYDQRRIGTRPQLEVTLAKSGLPLPEAALPAAAVRGPEAARKEKRK